MRDWPIEPLPLSALRRAEYNPREPLDEFTAEQLRGSLSDFGIVEPLVVNRRTGNTIVGGHQRFDQLVAFTAEGIIGTDFRVPCVIVDLDERSEMRLNVLLNKAVGRFDMKKLRDVIEYLDTGEDDSIEKLGFSDVEIERLMTSVPDPEEPPAIGGFEPADVESKTITAIVRCPVDVWPAVGETIRAACEKHGATFDTA